MDAKSASDAYYALLQLILEELRKNGKIYLPDWGEFRITEYKARTIGNVNTGVREMIAPTKVIKFTACSKLRKYIKDKI